MNNSLNEYLRFNFELNHFLARFNVKMNNQNVSPTPTVVRQARKCWNCKMKLGKVWAACATISETPLLSLKQGDLLPTGHFPMLWSAPSRNVFWHLFVFLEVISNLSEAATSVPFDIERHFLCRRESSSMFTNLKCTLLPLWSFGKWLYCQVGDFCVWGASLAPSALAQWLTQCRLGNIQNGHGK